MRTNTKINISFLTFFLLAHSCLCEQSNKLLCILDSQCDDHNPCTEDTCLLSLCFHSNTNSGTSCDDGLFCTTGDQCNGAGSCLGSQPKCTGQCNSYCNETAKTCFSPTGTVCDDGLWCTGQDFCNGVGNCSVHTGNPCTTSSGDCMTTECTEMNHCLLPGGSACTSDGNQCTDDKCNDQGICVHSSLNGTSCDDGVYCTINDKCAGTECGGSWNPACSCASAADCDDHNICTHDTCSFGNCEHIPNDGISCSDGNWCNGEEVCGGGVCQAAIPPCSSSNPCNGSCNNDTKTCHAPINTECEDHIFCNGDDFCNGQGLCVPSYVSPCGGECKNFCNETLGACADPEGTECDDGLFCNGRDSCDGSGQCVASGVDPCEGFPQCQDRCDEDLNECVNTANIECQGDFCGGAIHMCLSGVCSPVVERCNETFPICDSENQQCLPNITDTNSTTTTGVEENPSTSPDSPGNAHRNGDSNFVMIGAGSAGGVVLLGSIVIGICLSKRKKHVKHDSSQEEKASRISTGFYADVSGGTSNQENVWNTSLGNIIILDRVGVGNFGEVFKGLMQKDRNSPMVEVALKALKQDDSFSEFIEEASMLSNLDHPNIVKFFGLFVQDEKYIVTEFMNRGSLLDLLHCTSFPQYPCKEIALGAAKGMAYLHSKSVIHRDLACRNLLVHFSHGSYNVKISDFGMARAIERYYYSNSNMIPIRWSAPEALCYKKYSQPSDVWSFGIVLWELYSRGAEPYEGYTNVEVVDMVLQGYRLAKPEGCPDDMYMIMQLCWLQDKHERPSFDELAQLISQANVYKVTKIPPKQNTTDVVLRNAVEAALQQITTTEEPVAVFAEDDESLPPSYGANRTLPQDQ